MAEDTGDKTMAPDATGKGGKPAKQPVRNLQDTFLAQLRDTQTPVTVFLVSGVKLQGRVTDFDGFTVALTRDGATQLVYKRVISTIAPLGPLDLSDGHRPPSPTSPRPPRPQGPRRGPVSRPIVERRKLT